MQIFFTQWFWTLASLLPAAKLQFPQKFLNFRQFYRCSVRVVRWCQLQMCPLLVRVTAWVVIHLRRHGLSTCRGNILPLCLNIDSWFQVICSNNELLLSLCSAASSTILDAWLSLLLLSVTIRLAILQHHFDCIHLPPSNVIGTEPW